MHRRLLLLFCVITIPSETFSKQTFCKKMDQKLCFSIDFSDYQSGLRGSRSKPVPTQSEKYRRKPAPPGSQGSNFRRSEHSTRQGLSPGGGR